MFYTRLLRPALAAALALFLGACANKGKTGGDYGGGSGGYSDSDSVSGTPINGLGTPLPERQEGVSFLGSNVDHTRFEPVHFGFDSYTISSEERAKIERVADFMQTSPNTVVLAGFTDERGTPEYNRGLGERRAQAVRQALISAGGSTSRLQTVSFGAEMPVDAGSSESAWAKNRRTEFGVVR
ncbi:MAG: OmpA family protein [Verrucomicrobiota bacterium]